MTVSGTVDTGIEGYCACKPTGALEAPREVKGTAKAGLVSVGKWIAKNNRTITTIAERNLNSVIGFEMDRFSSIGDRVVELEI